MYPINLPSYELSLYLGESGLGLKLYIKKKWILTVAWRYRAI
jgi:hypothetical protein